MNFLLLLFLIFLSYHFIIKPVFIKPFREGLNGSPHHKKSKPIQQNPSSEVSKEKGDRFEKFVVKKFDPKYFKIKEWRSDKYIDGIYAESNSHPDFEIEFNFKDHTARFAVECKWRQNTFNGNLFSLGEEWKIKNYKRYEKEKKLKVHLVLGLGGEPDDPAELFLISLWRIENNFIPYDYLKKFAKQKESPFYYGVENKILK